MTVRVRTVLAEVRRNQTEVVVAVAEAALLHQTLARAYEEVR